jgi:hypothetical protein
MATSYQIPGAYVVDTAAGTSYQIPGAYVVESPAAAPPSGGSLLLRMTTSGLYVGSPT